MQKVSLLTSAILVQLGSGLSKPFGTAGLHYNTIMLTIFFTSPTFLLPLYLSLLSFSIYSKFLFINPSASFLYYIFLFLLSPIV